MTIGCQVIPMALLSYSVKRRHRECEFGCRGGRRECPCCRSCQRWRRAGRVWYVSVCVSVCVIACVRGQLRWATALRVGLDAMRLVCVGWALLGGFSTASLLQMCQLFLPFHQHAAFGHGHTSSHVHTFGGCVNSGTNTISSVKLVPPICLARWKTKRSVLNCLRTSSATARPKTITQNVLTERATFFMSLSIAIVVLSLLLIGLVRYQLNTIHRQTMFMKPKYVTPPLIDWILWR